MTLILKLDLDMVKMYLHTKKWSFCVKGFKSYSLNRQKHRQTDTHTHTHTDMTENITYLHTRVVKMRKQPSSPPDPRHLPIIWVKIKDFWPYIVSVSSVLCFTEWTPHPSFNCSCRWKGYKCMRDDFKLELTDMGYCYTFNYDSKTRKWHP